MTKHKISFITMSLSEYKVNIYFDPCKQETSWMRRGTKKMVRNSRTPETWFQKTWYQVVWYQEMWCQVGWYQAVLP